MRYRMVIEYDGAAFHGWQLQPNRASVQEALEQALATVLRVPGVRVTGSGRTDAGVHARGQVAHFDVPDGAVPPDPHRLQHALNGLLKHAAGGAVAVLGVEAAAPGFHARYDARERRYRYFATTEPRALDRHLRWHLRPAPDVAAMNRAAHHLLGTHDFESFCRTQSETQNRVCTVTACGWTEEARPGDLYFAIAADRFLHGMVRAIVGTLVLVGRGQLSEADVPRILAARDRRAAGPAAPAHGLVLEQVRY